MARRGLAYGVYAVVAVTPLVMRSRGQSIIPTEATAGGQSTAPPFFSGLPWGYTMYHKLFARMLPAVLSTREGNPRQIMLYDVLARRVL